MTVQSTFFLTLLTLTPIFFSVAEESFKKEKSSYALKKQPKDTSLGEDFLIHPKEAETFASLWCCSGIYAHFKSGEALYHSIQHGTALQSFLTEVPTNALYELQLTLRTQDAFEEFFQHDTITYLTEIKTFQNKNPLALIETVNAFVTKWVKDYQQNSTPVAINIRSSITTKRGKTIKLSPLSLMWDEREGIERSLRKLVLISGTTHTQSTYNATQNALSAALFFYLPPLLFLKFRGRYL